jgi:hypothetical protein
MAPPATASVAPTPLINLNQIRGSDFADSIAGSSSAMLLEQIEGGLGDDTLDGGAITDTRFQWNDNRVAYHNAPGAVTGRPRRWHRQWCRRQRHPAQLQPDSRLRLQRHPARQ